MAARPTIIIALDTVRLEEAEDIVNSTGDKVSFYKVGSILFTSCGPAAVEMVRARGKDVFLDLKFHDIPNTVMGAVEGAARMGVSMLTVHCSGGPEMMRAALKGAAAVAARPRVIGVTMLTSLRSATDTPGRVLGSAREAADAGLDGIVCSPLEVADVRRTLGTRLLTVVPGIRLAEDGKDDQARVATPGQAARAGADYIVVGRTVTGEKDRREAVARVVAELESAAG